MNFSSVHTLSPRDPALHALVRFPIEVPFHSIMGENHAGAVETSRTASFRMRAHISTAQAQKSSFAVDTASAKSPMRSARSYAFFAWS